MRVMNVDEESITPSNGITMQINSDAYSRWAPFGPGYLRR